MTKENIALLLTGVLILVIVGYLFFANSPKQAETASDTEPEEEPVKQAECPEFKAKYVGKPNVKNADKVDKAKPVHLGDYGKNVLYLQQRLNSEYDAGIQADGKFGCETFYAIQRLTGLNVEEGIDLNDIK